MSRFCDKLHEIESIEFTQVHHPTKRTKQEYVYLLHESNYNAFVNCCQQLILSN